jgi:DNA-binding response OmpR family regulator
MHMRKALLVSNDARKLARFRRVLSGLDLSFSESHVDALATHLADGQIDLVVADCRRSPEAVIQAVESATCEGHEMRLMLVVEPAGLAALEPPSRLKTDFFVEGRTPEEFVARVHSLAWPGEEVLAQELVRVGELTVNLATYQALRAGEVLDFSYLEYALLAFLITHPNRAHSRETLLKRVWGTDYLGGLRTVDVHVRRVRSKIGVELSARLETVRNVGYLWRS